MTIFRFIRRALTVVVVILLAMYIYDAYHSFQGTNRESKAKSTVEQRIEQNEDTLSGWTALCGCLRLRIRWKRPLRSACRGNTG